MLCGVCVCEREVCMYVSVCLFTGKHNHKSDSLVEKRFIFFPRPPRKPQRVTEHKREGREKEEEEVLLV